MSCPPGSLKSHTSKHMNWVEEQGGLPRYIERIACHVHFDKGHDVGSAIAIAVEDCKKMCATGQSNFGQVNSGAKAEACAAVSQWDAMKAAAGVKHGIRSGK